MWAVFEWLPWTLRGYLGRVGGEHGVDFAGFALGQVWALNKKVHCRSLSSIHILYNHTPAARLRPHPELCYGFDIVNCPERYWSSTKLGKYGFTDTVCFGYGLIYFRGSFRVLPTLT